MTLRIASGTIFEEYGGVSKHIFDIRRYSKHRVSIFPAKLTRIILNRWRGAKPSYKRMINPDRLRRYQIIHSHADPWFEEQCRQAKSHRCKWVHTFHSYFFPDDYEQGLAGWQELENFSLTDICSRADLRISVSPWLHDFLKERFAIETIVLENGVDIDMVQHIDGIRFSERYRQVDFILYIGGIREVKNPLFVLKLAEQLPKEKLVMIGEKLTFQNLKEKYHIDIPPNVILLGSLPFREVLEAMAACKVYLMTSKRESMPYSLLEAMSLGKAVVAPDHSGPQNVLSGTGAGLLYRPDSISDAIDKIRAATASSSLGNAARALIASRYDVRKQVAKLDELYDSLN